ncbi:transposable element Tcb1 transposase [Trichonephila clavipes]|nr:transposable element Tcb1 transposase [Trichonephila clavipes]
MVRGAILDHRRFNLLRIEGKLNSNRYVREVLQPEVVPFLQGITGVIFQQDKARSHIAKTVRNFCSAQRMQLLPWPDN